MNELISVIIPVFNAEPYLRQCVDSVLAQTYDDIEVILVDDGSQDQSGRICDDYQSVDRRIRVIHQENGGTSDARNHGLEIASGRYIGFVDCDDFIDPTFYKVLHDLIVSHQSDIAMVSYRTVENSKVSVRDDSGDERVLNREMSVQELLADRKVQNYVWNKLYRRELFETLRFPVHNVYDDVVIMYELFQRSSSVAFREEALYNYRIRRDSIVHTDSHRKREDALRAVLDRFIAVEKDFTSLHTVNAYAFVLWMVRLYSYTVIENDSDDAFIRDRMPMLRSLCAEEESKITKLLKPEKKVILYAMLWDMDGARQVVRAVRLAPLKTEKRGQI